MILPPDVMADVLRLHRAEKWKVGTIARQLKLHRRKVRQVLGLEPVPLPRERSLLLKPFRPCIEQWLTQYPSLRATRVHDMLQERGYQGSVRQVRRVVAELRPPKPVRVFQEIETLPGEQAQVDWAHVGKVTVPGGQRTMWLFVCTLSASRAIFAELVFELTAVSLARSLCRAGAHFGGVPRTWLFDNTKAVVLDRTADAARLHPLLLEVAGQLCVQPRLCAPYQPNHKGKVERSIRYLRDRVLAARSWNTVEDGNRALLQFLTTTALERAHPTRKTITVGQALAEEQPRLLSLPAVMPEPLTTLFVRPDQRGSVTFDGNRYSVPPRCVGRNLLLRASDQQVRLLDESACVAEHARCWGRHQRVFLPQHRLAIPAPSPEARRAKGLERLRLLDRDAMDRLLAALLEDGQNMGQCAIKLCRLLDLYGEELFVQALNEVLTQQRHSISAMALACEAARRRRQPMVPVPAQFSDHVQDHDVTPHNLEDYDD